MHLSPLTTVHVATAMCVSHKPKLMRGVRSSPLPFVFVSLSVHDGDTKVDSCSTSHAFKLTFDRYCDLLRLYALAMEAEVM